MAVRWLTSFSMTTCCSSAGSSHTRWPSSRSSPPRPRTSHSRSVAWHPTTCCTACDCRGQVYSIPEPGETWDENDIAGLYALTGQQFPVKPPGGQAGTIGATLSRSPGAGALAQAFRFAPDETSDAAASSPQSVTSYLPLPAVPPPAPNPAWSGSLRQRPGIASTDLWLGAPNRVRWTHTNSDKKPRQTTRGLVPMPPQISELPDAEKVETHASCSASQRRPEVQIRLRVAHTAGHLDDPVPARYVMRLGPPRQRVQISPARSRQAMRRSRVSTGSTV